MAKRKGLDADAYAGMHNQRRPDILWDDLKFVLAVAETHSFNQAAAKLDTDQTTVGRRVTRVEQALGLDLFARTATGTIPTRQGQRVIDEILGARLHIDRALDKLLAPEESDGEIKVALTDGLATYWLTRFIPWMNRRYPRLTIRIFSQEKMIENRTDLYDCQLQLVQPTGLHPLTVRVATLHYIPYVGRRYVEKRGLPKSRRELVNHQLIDFSGYLLDKGNWINWAGDERVAKNLTLFTTSSAFLLESVRMGAGIALVPTYLSCLYDDLVPCDLGIHAAANVYLLYREDRRTDWPARAAIELMRTAFNSKRMPWFAEQYVPPDSFFDVWGKYNIDAEAPAIAAE